MMQTNEELVSSELQNYIEELLKERAIKKHTMDISPATIKGDNYLGVIAKVVVIGEDKTGKSTTLNFIVKSAPKNELMRSLAPVRLIYGREIYVYDNVFPTFTKFQEEKGILQPFKSFTKCYASTMSNCNEGIIMEDMKALGFKLCDRKKPLDYKHTMLVLKEYGRFHAISYALRDQQPEVFEQLSDNTREQFFVEALLNEDMLKFVRETTQKALKSLDPVKDKVAYNKFNDFQDNAAKLVFQAVKSESAGKYAVINHGDCWTNNILFTYEDSANPNSPTELCLLDWQLSRTCSPALDLAYFIFACTDQKVRDEHYDDMIQAYYKSLSSFLRELGSDPEEMLPFEILQEHLKKFAVFGLYAASSLLYLMNSESDEIPDMEKAENLDELTKNFQYTSKNEEVYLEKIRAVILDFIKLGYDF